MYTMCVPGVHRGETSVLDLENTWLSVTAWLLRAELESSARVTSALTSAELSFRPLPVSCKASEKKSYVSVKNFNIFSNA